MAQPNKRPVVAMVPTVVYNPIRPCGMRVALGGEHKTSIVSGTEIHLVNTGLSSTDTC